LTLLIATADSIPNWNVTASCRGASSVGYAGQTSERLKSCLESEKQTREKLAVDWWSYPAADRANCIESIKWFEPTYTELAACLEMSRDVRKLRENAATPIKSR
jgi:hypothetical protein